MDGLSTYPTPTQNIAGQIKPAEKKLLQVEALKKAIIRGLSIYWLVSTVFFLLRIILEAIGSNALSPFAFFIYLVSNIFLLPFFGILPNFRNTIVSGQSTFDAPALLAIFCYSILIPLVMAVTYIAVKIFRTARQVEETLNKNNPIDPSVPETLIQ